MNFIERQNIEALVTEVDENLGFTQAGIPSEGITILETKFIDRDQEAQAKASKIVGLPEDIKVSPEALLVALNYEEDINYMLRTGEQNGDMGLELSEALKNREADGVNFKSTKSIGRAKKNLASTLEARSKMDKFYSEIVSKISEYFPEFQDPELYEQCARVLINLVDIGVVGDNQISLTERILKSLSQTGSLNFGLFVCPNNDFAYLNSNYPEDYLSTSAKGSLLEQQVPQLNMINRVVPKGSPVLTLIGDDDSIYLAPYYKLPDVEMVNGLYASNLKFRDRNEVLRSNVEQLLRKVYQKADVVSLGNQNYEIDGINTESLFRKMVEDTYNLVDTNTGEAIYTPEDVRVEMERMRGLMKGFYKDLVAIKGREPSDEEMEMVVRYKFAVYAVQGILMNAINPNLILIQAEKPPKLRDKMTNAGLRLLGMPLIPSIYI